MHGHHRAKPLFARPRSARPPVAHIAIHLHPCASCGTPTAWTWFCFDCRDSAQPHVEDDPYDDLGGEAS
jgi:hypothetical protein